MIAFNSGQSKLQDGEAWVIGGSIAGLLAAGALAKHYSKVYVVDRDPSIGTQDPRKGAPQGRHVHALLPRGVAAAETLFPGISEEIINGGANHGDLCEDAQWCPGGHRLKRNRSNTRVIASSRPFIESFFAQRLQLLPNVEFVTNVIGCGFRTIDGRVTDIELRDRDGKQYAKSANVVVDATGRASKLPSWLEKHGYHAPPEDSIDVKIGYASVRFRCSSAKNVNLKALIIGAATDVPRGGIAQAVEHDILQVSLAAYSETPPTNMQEFVEYAKTLAQPDIYNWLQGAEPIDEIKTHGIPKAYRRRFDKIPDIPEGLLAIGDSICAFNPVYAQGMTIAALEAQELDKCLAKRLGKKRKRVSKHYFKAIRSITETAWTMGSTSDLSMPIIDGQLSFPNNLIAKWIDRVQLAGTRDSSIAQKFVRVAALLDPPSSLLAPAFVWRVWKANRKSGRGSNEQNLVGSPS